jgi:hypothetical protein
MIVNSLATYRYTERFAPCLHDVLPLIFQYLVAEDGSLGDLVSATCVCRDWAAAGVPLRWRSVSSESLARIGDASRRQFYANAIHVLTVRPPRNTTDINFQDYELLTPLSFARLRRFRIVRIGIDLNHLRPGSPGSLRLTPFLAPRLEEVECYAGDFVSMLAENRLADKCPRLRRLHLYDFRCSREPDPGGSPRPEASGPAESSTRRQSSSVSNAADGCRLLADAVQSLQTLGALEVPYASIGACSGDVYKILAAHASLKLLSLGTLNCAMLQRVVHGMLTEQPFSALQLLNATIASHELPLVVAAVPGIKDLFLRLTNASHGSISDDDDSVDGDDPHVDADTTAPLSAAPSPLSLHPLAALQHLRKLSLSYTGVARLTGADLAGLLRLSSPQHLRELAIGRDYGHDAGRCMTWLDGFADVDLAALAARFPQLQLLAIDACARGRLTPAAFRIAGERCRELHELTLPCKCYPTALEGARVAPLFPQLRFLDARDPQPGSQFWDYEDWELSFCPSAKRKYLAYSYLPLPDAAQSITHHHQTSPFSSLPYPGHVAASLPCTYHSGEIAMRH